MSVENRNIMKPLLFIAASIIIFGIALRMGQPLYNLFSKPAEKNMEELEVSYRDYFVWQKNIEGMHFTAALENALQVWWNRNPTDYSIISNDMIIFNTGRYHHKRDNKHVAWPIDLLLLQHLVPQKEEETYGAIVKVFHNPKILYLADIKLESGKTDKSGFPDTEIIFQLIGHKQLGVSDIKSQDTNQVYKEPVILFIPFADLAEYLDKKQLEYVEIENTFSEGMNTVPREKMEYFSSEGGKDYLPYLTEERVYNIPYSSSEIVGKHQITLIYIGIHEDLKKLLQESVDKPSSGFYYWINDPKNNKLWSRKYVYNKNVSLYNMDSSAEKQRWIWEVKSRVDEIDMIVSQTFLYDAYLKKFKSIFQPIK